MSEIFKVDYIQPTESTDYEKEALKKFVEILKQNDSSLAPLAPLIDLIDTFYTDQSLLDNKEEHLEINLLKFTEGTDSLVSSEFAENKQPYIEQLQEKLDKVKKDYQSTKFTTLTDNKSPLINNPLIKNYIFEKCFFSLTKLSS